MIWLLHPHFLSKGEYQTIRPWRLLLRYMLVWRSNQRRAKWMTFYWLSVIVNFVLLDDIGFCKLPINHFHANAEVSWESWYLISVLQVIFKKGWITNVPLNAISINILWTSHVQRYINIYRSINLIIYHSRCFSIAGMIQPYMNNLSWAIENNYVACLPIGCVYQTKLFLSYWLIFFWI